jgi:hypothetical protein
VKQKGPPCALNSNYLYGDRTMSVHLTIKKLGELSLGTCATEGGGDSL